MDRWAPFTKDVICQHQTLYPGMGIEVAGSEDSLGFRQAVGFAAIPLGERYQSFRERLDRRLCSRKE